MIIKMIVVIRGMLFHIRDTEVVVVAELIISNIKVVIVIGIYMYKFNSVIVGL